MKRRAALAVLRAVLRRRPVILCDHGVEDPPAEGGDPEYLLVPPARVREQVELLRDPARRERMAAASRARHAAHFTVARMVAETAAVYETVLGG